MQFMAIYIHIPFCRVRCSYCAFNIYTDQDDRINDYIKAIGQEVAYLATPIPVRSIYLGGGTPSRLSARQLSDLINILIRTYTLTPNCEITLEINPEDSTLEYLRTAHKLGINRLSIGMQTEHAERLQQFGRGHTHSQTRQVIDDARQAGFANISLDLIYGLPEQSLAEWATTLQAALALEPDHFSLYALQVESGTQIRRWIKAGVLPWPDDDLTADMYTLAGEQLGAAGYTHYEISSWGVPSQHNLQYWRNEDYLGLGAGAHGYANGVRTVNTMRPDKYIQRLSTAQPGLPFPRTSATQSYEMVNTTQMMFETIMLNLRLLSLGLSRKSFAERFGISLEHLHGETIHRLMAEGLLFERDDTLFLTPAAYLTSNYVLRAFLPEEA